MTRVCPLFVAGVLCCGSLAQAAGTECGYRIHADDAYVRARISFTQTLPDGGLERYYAWTQPYFTDDRGSQP